MDCKPKKILTAIITIATLALVSAPTITTTNNAFAASFDPFSIFKNFNFDPSNIKSTIDNLKNAKSGKDNNNNNPPSSGNNNNNNPPSSGNNNNQPCKVDNSQKGTHFYCFTSSGKNTHHHCKPGPDNPLCKKT